MYSQFATNTQADILSYRMTDTGNAERLVAVYGNDIRCVNDLKRWLRWDGARWKSGDDDGVRNLVVQAVRETKRSEAIEMTGIRFTVGQDVPALLYDTVSPAHCPTRRACREVN